MAQNNQKLTSVIYSSEPQQDQIVSKQSIPQVMEESNCAKTTMLNKNASNAKQMYQRTRTQAVYNQLDSSVPKLPNTLQEPVLIASQRKQQQVSKNHLKIKEGQDCTTNGVKNLQRHHHHKSNSSQVALEKMTIANFATELVNKTNNLAQSYRQIEQNVESRQQKEELASKERKHSQQLPDKLLTTSKQSVIQPENKVTLNAPKKNIPNWAQKQSSAKNLSQQLQSIWLKGTTPQATTTSQQSIMSQRNKHQYNQPQLSDKHLQQQRQINASGVQIVDEYSSRILGQPIRKKLSNAPILRANTSLATGQTPQQSINTQFDLTGLVKQAPGLSRQQMLLQSNSSASGGYNIMHSRTQEQLSSLTSNSVGNQKKMHGEKTFEMLPKVTSGAQAAMQQQSLAAKVKQTFAKELNNNISNSKLPPCYLNSKSTKSHLLSQQNYRFDKPGQAAVILSSATGLSLRDDNLNVREKACQSLQGGNYDQINTSNNISALNNRGLSCRKNIDQYASNKPQLRQSHYTSSEQITNQPRITSDQPGKEMVLNFVLNSSKNNKRKSNQIKQSFNDQYSNNLLNDPASSKRRNHFLKKQQMVLLKNLTSSKQNLKEDEEKKLNLNAQGQLEKTNKQIFGAYQISKPADIKPTRNISLQDNFRASSLEIGQKTVNSGSFELIDGGELDCDHQDVQIIENNSENNDNNAANLLQHENTQSCKTYPNPGLNHHQNATSQSNNSIDRHQQLENNKGVRMVQSLQALNALNTNSQQPQLAQKQSEQGRQESQMIIVQTNSASNQINQISDSAEQLFETKMVEMSSKRTKQPNLSSNPSQNPISNKGSRNNSKLHTAQVKSSAACNQTQPKQKATTAVTLEKKLSAHMSSQQQKSGNVGNKTTPQRSTNKNRCSTNYQGHRNTNFSKHSTGNGSNLAKLAQQSQSLSKASTLDNRAGGGTRKTPKNKKSSYLHQSIEPLPVPSSESIIKTEVDEENNAGDKGSSNQNTRVRHSLKDMFSTQVDNKLNSEQKQTEPKDTNSKIKCSSPLHSVKHSKKLQQRAQAVNSTSFMINKLDLDSLQLNQGSLHMPRLSQPQVRPPPPGRNEKSAQQSRSPSRNDGNISELELYERDLLAGLTQSNHNPSGSFGRTGLRYQTTVQDFGATSIGAGHWLNNEVNKTGQILMHQQTINASNIHQQRSQIDASSWLPETNQFVQELLLQQAKNSSPQKGGHLAAKTLGPGQLLSHYHRRKPFQIKGNNTQGKSALIQGHRDSVASKQFNSNQREDLLQSTSILNQAQPHNLISSAANQCLSSRQQIYTPNHNQTQQQQLQQQQMLRDTNMGYDQDDQDNILVTGVKKGLQPQIGRNIADQISQHQQTWTTEDAHSRGGMMSSSKYTQQYNNLQPSHNSMMRTQTAAVPQRYSLDQNIYRHGTSTNTQTSSSAAKNRNQMLSANLLQTMNSNQLQSFLTTKQQEINPSIQQVIDPNSYLTVPQNNGSSKVMLNRAQVAQREIKDLTTKMNQPLQYFSSEFQLMQHQHRKQQAKAFMQNSVRNAGDSDKTMTAFVRHQLEAQQKADKMHHEESMAMQQYQKLMQREIEKLRMVTSTDQKGAGPQGIVNHQRLSSNAPFSPMQSHQNALKQQNTEFPMSIQTCQQQRLVDYICVECHGLILFDQSKRSIYAEHFLICQCLYNKQQHQSNQQQHFSAQNSYETSPIVPRQQSFHQQELPPSQSATVGSHQQARLQLRDQRCQSIETGRDQLFGSDGIQNDIDELGLIDASGLESTQLKQLKEMQMRLLNSHPRNKLNSIQTSNNQPQFQGSQTGHRRSNNLINAVDDGFNLTQGSLIGRAKQDGTDLANLKTFIKKQVFKFYQNNLFNEHSYLREREIECKGQTLGGLIMSKPLGSTLQEARKMQAYERDRRLNSTGKVGNSPSSSMLQHRNQELTFSALNERKLRQKTKSSNQANAHGSQQRQSKMKAEIDMDFEQSSIRRRPNSDINTFFAQINEFVKVTLKFKETITQVHLAQIRKLGRQIGLKFGSVRELDAKFINSKDFVAILKSKIFCMLNAVVMKIGPSVTDVHQSLSQKTFKFYVEPSGNNHSMVRSVIKRRSWYSSQELSQEHGWSGPGPKLLNLIWTQVRRPRVLRELQPYQIYNHLDGINEVAQKSNLFVNMRSYYGANGLNVFDYMPETYLVPSTSAFEMDPQFQAFKQASKPDQLWIFKPGESSNRGNGIRVFNNYEKIRQHMVEVCRNAENRRGHGRQRNCIIQKYMTKPLLIQKRKFDIRVFALAVCHADTGLIRGYFYDEGYLRTSSKDYNIEKWDNRLIHLTNDAVQKNSADYGKYESANKISYQDFDKHLMKEKNVSFLQTIVPKIKEMVTDVFDATGRGMYRPLQNADGVSRSQDAVNYNGFELMGFDFMLDSDLKLVLIEVNTNPCLDTPCMLLQRMIPQVLDQTLKLAVDPFLQASEHQYYMTQDLTVAEMRFSLVYQDSMELSKRDQQCQKIGGNESNKEADTNDKLEDADKVVDQELRASEMTLPELVNQQQQALSQIEVGSKAISLEVSQEYLLGGEEMVQSEQQLLIQPNPNEPE